LKIWNLGTEASKIDSVLNFGNVMQTNDCGALAPGASCTVQVSVTPNGQTANQLAINYDTNINDSNHSGTGGLEQNYFIFAPESQQQLSLSTKGIAFGHQNVGGNGLVRAVTVTNTGSSSASAPAVSIQGAADFTVAANTCTATLQAHQSCVVGVKFVPSGNGVRTGTLSIVNGSTASLFGIAEINSAVKVAPLDLDFFTIVIGHTFSNDVVLTNTTNSAIGISNISISQPEFTQTNDCAGSIPASGSCTVHISFTPQHAVTKNASMTITFAGNVAAQVINMTGTGATPFDVTPTSIDFGNDTLVGGTSDMQFVSMGNGRGAFSQAYTLSLTGDFVIAQNPCANPLPGFVGCALQIEFKPTHPGSQQGALTISYPGISDQTVVTFTGSTAPSFVAQPSAGSSFSATVSPGSTATYNLTYNAAAAFSGTVQLSCSGIPAHAACNLQPASLDLTTARSGSVTVKISTTSQTASMRNHHPTLLFAAIFCMPFLLGTFVHKRKAILGSVALLMILAVGCGGGSGGGTNPPPPPSNTTPVGTYTILVTATGGGDTETTPLTLTVHN
jgi:hypothetical protein